MDSGDAKEKLDSRQRRRARANPGGASHPGENSGAQGLNVGTSASDKDGDIFALGTALKELESGGWNIDDIFGEQPNAKDGAKVQLILGDEEPSKGKEMDENEYIVFPRPRIYPPPDNIVIRPEQNGNKLNGGHREVISDDKQPLMDEKPEKIVESSSSSSSEEEEEESSDDYDTEDDWFADEPDVVRKVSLKQLKKIKNSEPPSGGVKTADVSDPDDNSLPTVQQIIVNYNNMLESDPTEFVNTLFRAVKLNRVDVVKILCQLTKRKKISLASAEMREPESSATALHVALLCKHADMVNYILSLGDHELTMATYINSQYKDQTSLHVAVTSGKVELVEGLLDSLKKKKRKILMNKLATGTYFRTHHPDGQMCLTAAAYAGDGDMLFVLAEYGANFALLNKQGDTVLHRIVHLSVEGNEEEEHYTGLVDDVYHAIGLWAEQRHYDTNIPEQRMLEKNQKQVSTFMKLLRMRNQDGLNPISLAAKLGSPLLQHFLNMEHLYKIPQTKLGSTSWITYDVTDVASYASGSYNKFSVLHVLAHSGGSSLTGSGEEGEHISTNFLEIEPIKTLLENKWDVYRKMYVGWCFWHIIYMISLTFFAFSLNSGKSRLVKYVFNSTSGEESVIIDKGTLAAPMGILLITPFLYIFFEMLDIFANGRPSFASMRNMRFYQKIKRRLDSEISITGNGPYRIVCLSHALAIFAWAAFYMGGSQHQDVALSIALLLGWFFVLFFTRGCRHTSRFSVMIQKMFFMDLMYFLAVYIIVLLAFTFSLVPAHDSFISIGFVGQVTIHMLGSITSVSSLDELPPPKYPTYIQIMWIMYSIVAVILLMNMLIALMNTSYEMVKNTGANMCRGQQLSILMMLERRMVIFKRLCRRSESKNYYKLSNEELRAYLDVTE